MKEIKVGLNDNQQRADRFLKKYFSEANNSFLQKMIRKKRIKLNNSRVNPDDIVYEGDIFQVYFSDETIEKYRGNKSDKEKIINQISENYDVDVVYEDSNIIILSKPAGILSHGADVKKDEDDIVSRMVSYLYRKGEYRPESEMNFTPAICNRLDRNTSGLIIGAKNYETLKSVNESIRIRNISRLYKSIVKGKIDSELKLNAGLKKSGADNIVYISDEIGEDDKEIETVIRPAKYTEDYTEVEIELITGRTHQIRAHLAHIGHPVIGDRKYGEMKLNNEFREKFGLRDQLLHAYKLILNGFGGNLEYLNGKVFIDDYSGVFKKIEESIFI